MARQYKPLVQIASRISEEAKTRLTTQANTEKVTLSELISNILEDANNTPKIGDIQKQFQDYISANNAVNAEFDTFVDIVSKYLLKKDFVKSRTENIDAITQKINDEQLKKEAIAKKRAKK